ncbi:MAG: energy transducer TonB [Verrucomicrobia bacterium]|nr:energy transducer TonB [Verrucomicrobiota bacterium]
MRPEAADTPFVFDWGKENLGQRLPFLLGMSFLGHMVCFYLFQVVYPTTTAILPRSAEVTVLDPKRSQDREIQEWAESNNPATASAPELGSDLIAKVMPPYHPIFNNLAPELMPMSPPAAKKTGPPLVIAPDDLLPLRPATHDSAKPQRFETQLSIGSTLQDRAPEKVQALPPSRALSPATSLFIGVGPSGSVDFVFVRQSAGSSELDQQAEKFVRNLRFRPASGASWGVVTVRWGSSQHDQG